MCNTLIKEYQMDFINFSNLIADMVKKGYISNSNFRLMSSLINNNYIHYDQLRSCIIKLYDLFYHPHVSCIALKNVWNYHIHSYLLSVFAAEYNYEVAMYSLKLASELGVEFASESNEYVLYSVYDVITYYYLNDDYFFPINVPVKVVDSKKKMCDTKKSPELPMEVVDCEKEKCDVNEGFESPVDCDVKECNEFPVEIVDCVKKNRIIFDENDFNSFILPLQQDYTKSSEGYRLQSAAIIGKQISSSYNKNNLDEFDYDREFSENCTSSSSVIFKNNKIESQKSCGSTSTEIKCSSNSSANEMSKHCDKLSHNSLENSVHNCLKTMPSESSSRSVIMPLAIPNCYNDEDSNDKDENDDSDSDDIVFSRMCETGVNNDDSFDQDDDCADLMSDEEDSDDDVIFSEEIVYPEQTQGLMFSLAEFSVSPVDSDSDDESVSFLDPGDFEVSSLSQEKNYTMTPIGSEGFACFEDDDGDDETVPYKFRRLKIVNNNWNIEMKDFPSEPRESKRVSFMPPPDLVSVRFFEPDNDGYKYSVYVMDKIRFRDRIKEFEIKMSPYLTQEHRANVYQNHFLSKE